MTETIEIHRVLCDRSPFYFVSVADALAHAESERYKNDEVVVERLIIPVVTVAAVLVAALSDVDTDLDAIAQPEVMKVYRDEAFEDDEDGDDDDDDEYDDAEEET